jgi:hypothetical protein
MRRDVSVEEVNHPRYSFRVRFPGPDGGTVQKWFKNKTAANAFAKDRRREIGREGLAFGVIGDDEKAAVQFWRGFVTDVSDTPPPALLTILQDHAENWKATRSSVTVAAAVDAYEVAKTAEGLRKIRQSIWKPPDFVDHHRRNFRLDFDLGGYPCTHPRIETEKGETSRGGWTRDETESPSSRVWSFHFR